MDSFDVCILARHGTESFQYCNDYTKPCLPVVVVTMYKNNVLYHSKGIMDTMDKRWASQFRYIPLIILLIT